MISANELRVGNWLTDHTGINNQVLSIGVGWVKFIDNEVCAFDLGNPIALTKEWLLKMGFKNTHGRVYFFNKLKFSYEKNELSQFVRFHYSGKVAYLQYVHQLQNLYWCLTGQELNINN